MDGSDSDSVDRNEHGGTIRWSSVDGTRLYQTGHYLVTPDDMASILESLETTLHWDVIDVDGSVTATADLGTDRWIRFNFIRFNSGDKYIMEGEGFSISDNECRRHIPSRIEKILVSNKPIQYTKF